MNHIVFIGCGNMGGPMALNLAKSGYNIIAIDNLLSNLDKLRHENIVVDADIASVIYGHNLPLIVISSLPSGAQVRAVYQDLIAHLPKNSILIDCSTTDVATAKWLADLASEYEMQSLDAPVSGGVKGAADATLTIMVGGEEATYQESLKILQKIGKNIIYCGASGNGQAAKIINNMMLAVQMNSICEGFVLAQKLGLPAEKLFAVASVSSAQCWSLNSYAPVAGLVPSAPVNREFTPGFAAGMMLKDCNLALQVMQSVDAILPLATKAAQRYQEFVMLYGENLDFSAIIQLIQRENSNE